MTPIPAAAMPVVEVLRRDVPAPGALPSTNGALVGLFWYFRGGTVCPMGLHPLAREDYPTSKKEFPVKGIRSKEIDAFMKWWDAFSDTDALAACEAIWPDFKVRATP